MTAIDLAYEHCLWGKRAGLSPRAVIRSVGGVVAHYDHVGWLDAVAAVKHARMALGAKTDRRAAL